MAHRNQQLTVYEAAAPERQRRIVSSPAEWYPTNFTRSFLCLIDGFLTSAFPCFQGRYVLKEESSSGPRTLCSGIYPREEFLFLSLL